MISLPTSDVNIEDRLPVAYEAAKQALATCGSIELCLGWMRRSEAIERAAQAAGNTVMYKLSLRLSARVMRRAGELLKMSGWSDPILTTAPENEVASRSGMSTYQQLVAIQLAELPEEKFERWLESDDPPTVNRIGVPLSPDARGLDSAAKPVLADVRSTMLEGVSPVELRGHETGGAAFAPNPHAEALEPDAGGHSRGKES
jgi:hypothetical protein